MKKDIDRLERLKAITSLIAERALAPVSAAGNKVQHAERQATALADHRKDLMKVGTDPVLAGTMLAQAERLRHLQAAALQKVAAARVAFEQEKAKALRDVGRDHAVGRLLEDQKAAARLEALRRKLR